MTPESFLILVVPGAEPLVGPWRAEHDWSAAAGVPAHVTVRSHFLPEERWDEAGRLAGFLPLETTLARVENRPGALVVLAEPDDGLRELTAAASAAWPELEPHKGGRPDAAYHVTVVRRPDPAVREAARAAIEPRLPLRVAGTELWAVAGGPPETDVRRRLVARATGAASAARPASPSAAAASARRPPAARTAGG